MKRTFILSISFLFVAATSAAMAADPVPYDPAPGPAHFSWEGAYIGGQIGYGWGTSRLRINAFDRLDPDDDFSNTNTLKPNGFLGGVYAGYNVDVGSNVFLGLEADVVGTAMRDSYTERDDDDFGSFSMERKLKWAGAVRARAGYYAWDRFLPYIAGGVAFGQLKTTINLDDDSARDLGRSRFSEDRTLIGWTIGGGLDYAATDNIILRLEYRYTDYGDNSQDYGFFSGSDRFKSNDIRLGVAYKF